MARRTVLVCDNCGKEVGENKGAALRLTYTDARRGAKSRRSLRRLRRQHARPAGRTPRPPAEGAAPDSAAPPRCRRLRAAAPQPRGERSRAATGAVSVRHYHGTMGLTLARRARECGQGRASARAVSRASRRRAVPDRAEPVGRRPRRARPARARGLPPRRDDRHLRRPLRADRRAAIRRARPVATRRAARARRPPRARGSRRSTASRARRASRGFADALLATLGELESGLLDPTDLDGDLAALYAAYRAELDRLGLWDRDLLRRRAAERLARRPRRVARRAGLRLRLRGPDRRRVVAARGARRARRRARLAPLRAGARRVRVARGGRRRISPRSPTGASRSCRRGRRSTPRRRSRTSSARSSTSARRRPAADRRRRALPRGRRRARHARARRRGAARASPRAARPRRAVALVCPSLERWRAPLETVVRTLGIPYAVEARVRLPQTPLGHALLSLLRFAWLGGGRARALRLPPLAVLRRSRARAVDFVEGRLRGRAVQHARARRGGDASGCARRRSRRCATCARPRRRSTACATLLARRCCAPPTGSTLRPSGDRRGSTCARTAQRSAAARRARGLGAPRRARRCDDVVAALERRRSRRRRPRSRAASPCST